MDKPKASPNGSQPSSPPPPYQAEPSSGASPSAGPKVEPSVKPSVDLLGESKELSKQDIERCASLLLLDSTGQSRPFRSIYSGPGTARRQLIIFVRHFFCGNCQEYLKKLSASIRPESLISLPEPAFITIIGCGRPELIDMYTKETSCPFPIYADPTRKLYESLGMTRTLDPGSKPEYIQTSMVAGAAQSILQGIKTGTKALKGGDFMQVGGEFLFEGGVLTWHHRMKTTRDHTEIAELRRVLGLKDEPST